MTHKKNYLAIRRTLSLLSLLLWAFIPVGVWAQTSYISDVMVIGGTQSEVDAQWNTLQTEGWTRINYDLNYGCSTGTPNIIYLLYKTSTNSADAITDFYLSTASNAGSGVPGQITHKGHDYTLTPYAGGTQFTNNKGDLNSGVTGSTNIHLYYTKQAFTIARYITGISFDDFADNGLGADGNNSTGYNLNNNAGGYSIYMHLTKQFPDGWIEVFNYSQLDLGTHTNNAKILIGANIILLNRVIINGITATIDLNGYTIDRNLTSSGGSDGHVIAIINGATLTLNATGGGTLTAGYADNGGGIWIASGCQLYMSGANIAGCRANKAAAIYNNGTLVMNNCTISNNIAEDVGGVYNAANATASINNCYFGGNNGNTGCGSIGNATTASSMTITNTTIENSHAGTNGGGIWNGSTLSLTDVIIRNCDATRNGGGIYNEGTLNIEGGSITDNSSGILGCGIYTSGTLNMKGNPVVSGNHTAAPSGLQSITYNIYLDNNTKVNVTGAFTTGANIGVTPTSYANLITSGYSTYNSGVAAATYFFSDTGTEVELKDGEIKIVDFITDVIVGSASSIGDDETMKNTLESYGWTVLAANLNPGGTNIYNTVRMAYKTNNSYASSGTPITDFYLKTGNDHPATFTYEGRTYHLAGVYSGNGCISNYQGDLNSGSSDPKIWLYYTNDAWTYGRYFTDIVFTNSQLGGVGADGQYDEGFNLDEGITYSPRNIYMHPTMVVTDPSPIYVYRDRDVRDLLNVNGVTVKLGYDVTLISSLHIHAVNSNVTLDLNNHNLNLYYSSSQADKGHVLKVYNGCTLNVTGGGILQGGWADYGGGVKVDGGGTIYMNGCTIQNCKATQTGGAIHNAGTFVLNNCTLTNNITYNGGAIYNDGTLTVTGTTITGNTAYDHGGAIYNNGGTLHVENSSITSNNAVDVGGIYNKASGTATISGCMLSGNRGTDGCGAIGNSTDAGLMTINNTSITGNTASTNGGGIWNGSSIALSNVTITGNSCGDSHNGGGIFLRGNSLTMSDNIVVSGNLKGSAANNVYLENGKRITVNGAFSEGTTIGITLENTGNVATTGYSTQNAGVDPATYFVSDQFYGIVLNNDGEVVQNTAVQVMPANYIDADGTERTEYTCFKLSTIGSTLGTGWYVVDEDVTFNNRINVNGHVHLILTDGTTLNAANGIHIENNAAKSLTIYGQSYQSGQLIAYGADESDYSHSEIYRGDAAIGGNWGQLNGVITINGGVVEVHGGAGSAGIGDGTYYGNESNPAENGGLITINRGTVNAYGGDGGAGIGGGYAGSGGNIVINDGTVNATGGSYYWGGGSYYCAAGIGGGYLNYVNSSITINGGVINATGGHSAAGIGQGDGLPNTNRANITLNWTEATAATESIFANKYAGTVTFALPFVADDGSGIYQQGGIWTNNDLANKTLIPYRGNNITFGTMEHGSMVASQNPAYTTTTVTLTSTPDEGYVCSDITITGNLTGREITATRIGTTSNFTFVMPSEDVTVTPVFENSKVVISYIDLNGDEQTVVANNINSSSFNSSLTAGWWTMEATYLTNRLVVASGADVNLILRDGIETNASRGINVPQGTSLTIWRQSAGTGTLRGGSSISAGNGTCHAGIGGNEQEISGTITINGGIIDIDAHNSLGAAGIGGGGNYDGNTGARGTVIINGGTVTARGGSKGAGIGGGYKRCGTVTINGGTVTGYSEGGSGIGSGLSCASNVSRTVTINGGTVTVTALEPLAGSNIAYGDGIGGDNCTVNINGGTVTASGYYNGSGICGTTVTITDAEVSANKGSNNGYGIKSTTTTLDYTDHSRIFSSSYSGTVTLANLFVDEYDESTNPHPSLYSAGDANNSTLAGKTLVSCKNYFARNGNWNNADNWEGGIPTSEEDAYIFADAIIPDGYTARARYIMSGSSGSITIADGGQLVPFECLTEVTVQKSVVAKSWKAITSSVYDNGTEYYTLDSRTNLTSGSYDLFVYDEPTATWLNKKAGNGAEGFGSLELGRGYIYRNDAATTISSRGYLSRNGRDFLLTVTPAAGDFAGFHLVGNPFTYSIDISHPIAVYGVSIASGYYALSPDGTWQSHPFANAGELGVGEAVLIQATSGEGYFRFQIEPPTTAKGTSHDASKTLAFNVSDGKHSDVTYALIENGKWEMGNSGLKKIVHLNDAAPMVYIPQEGIDYAIAEILDGSEEFPLEVSGREGRYEIGLMDLMGEMGIDYCHLIDLQNGKDVDLLKQTTYAFNNSGKARFLVRLAPGNSQFSISNFQFAYRSGDQIIINGTGTLQVFDILGRQLFTKEITTFNSQFSISNFPGSGVYILRLNDQTQKIVIR